MDKITKILGTLFRITIKFFGDIFRLVFGFAIRLILEVVDWAIPVKKIEIAYAVKNRFPKFWNWIMSVEWVKKRISEFTIRKFGRMTKPRPHAFTMAVDYTTWYGAIDRSWTGRHLPPSKSIDRSKLPSIDEVVDLFVRGTSPKNPGKQVDCIRSSFLFAAFAQWFTDSFLRTVHSMDFDEKTGNAKKDKDGALVRLTGREKRNTSNHEIDLCQIYGLNERQTSILRLKDEKKRGRLKSQPGKDGEYAKFLLTGEPKDKQKKLPLHEIFKDLHPDERILREIFRGAEGNPKGYDTLFACGLEHGNGTVGNALLNTVFLREHNRVADLIAKSESDWDDERVFQTTRNVMMVLLLKIVVSDYIRHISPLGLPIEVQPGLAESENWYRTNRIAFEFNLLYRWHSLVPNEFSFLPDPKNVKAIRHNNAWLLENGVGSVIEMFSKEKAGRITLGNTPWFLGGVKRESVTMMRDAEFASYNDYRERFNLLRLKSFEEISDDKELVQKLREMYHDDIDMLEWYVGLFAEKHGTDMIMSELLLGMVGHDAFTQALTNPLLSNELFNPTTFSLAGWEVIKETSTLNQIVQRVTPDGENPLCSFSI